MRSPHTDTHDLDREASAKDSARPRRPLRRIRYARAALLPLAVGVICAIPLAIGLGPWGLLVLIPFVLAAIALLRVGADITEQEVLIRGALSTVPVRRDELTGLSVPDDRHVHLVRRDGSTVRIPTVRPRDLPGLRSALFGVDDPQSPQAPADPSGPAPSTAD